MILCLIFSITGVSASDVNTTDNQVLSATPDIDTLSASVNTEQNNNTQSVSENNLLSAGNDDSGSNNLLGADEETGSFTDLDKLIKLSQGELTLTQNYKYNPDTDSAFANGISISKTITIDGNNYIINGSDVASIFVVDANNVIIKNLNIINAPQSIVWNGHDGKLINTKFNNITQIDASSRCVIWYGTSGEILNSTFNDIKYNLDSNVAIGVVYIGGEVNIINSTFSNISKSSLLGFWGSAISIPTTASMNNKIIGCSFINCTSRGNSVNRAGLVYAQRNVITVINCSFINNSLHSSTRNSYGIFGEPVELHVTDCLFTENDVDRLADCKYVEISGSTFINESYYYDCLGSSNMNYIDVTDCTFKNINKTTIIDFKNDGFLNVNNTSFININGANTVINQKSGSYALISSCNFTNSSVTGSAPIILNKNKNIIEDCLFDNTTGTDAYAIDIKEGAFLNLENYKVINTLNILPNITGNITPSLNYPVLYLKDSSNVYNDSAMTNRVGDSLEWAITNVDYLGTIYLYNNVFDLNSIQYPIISNIIGDNKVIINYGSFKYNVPNIKVENITFNDTKSYFNLVKSQLINCTFNNTNQSTTGFIVCSYGSVAELYNLTFINYNANSQNQIITLEEHNRIDGLDIQGVINGKNIIYCNEYGNDVEIRHVNVTNSIFDTFYYKVVNQYNNGIFEYINITGNTFKTFHNNIGTNYRFNNITIANNKGYNNGYLFFVRNGFTFDNITVINTHPTVGVFGLNGDLVLQDSYFENIATTSFIRGNYYYSLDNVTLKTVNFQDMSQYYKINMLNRINVSDANFTNGIIFTLGNDLVLSDSSFTDFTGHVVVAGNNVIIRDTNFTRGNNSDLNGSAVYAQSGDFLTIENCRFISNNASYGGAVYSNINPTAIMNSVFQDNNALARNGTTSCGGAIYIGDVYQTIDKFTRDTLDTDPVNYNDLRLFNESKSLFDVIYIVPKWQEYTNESGEHGDGSGSDINNPTNLTDARIKAGPYCKIYFINNNNWNINYYNMTNATINPDGNVVEFVVRYSGMVFYGNNSVIDNLYFTVDAANTTFKDLTFANNTGHSALVINQEDSVVDNCTFLNNGGDAVSAGAAIQVLANNTSILNSTFTGNVAGNVSGANGGAVFINASYISISDCHFSDNNASNTGSHLFVVDDNELHDIKLIDCNFTGGHVIGSGMGSGVYLSGDNLVVYNSNFTDNIGRQGAGLTVTGSTINLNITGNTFSDNCAVPQGTEQVSDNFGGAIFFDSSRGPVSIEDNTFTGNNASVDGGALYINNMPGQGNTFADNVFHDNHALTGNGGALYVNKTVYPLTVSGGEFTDNNASGNGGALYVNDPVNINNAIFNGNNATLDGGAIYNNNTLSLNSNAFNGNGAVNGGAIYNNGVLVDKGSRYISNNATRDGGAIYSKSDLDYTAGSSVSQDFVGNRAVNGGALYINGTNNNIRGAFFTGNIADYGSCIYVENNTDLNIYDTSIVNNHVTYGSQVDGGHGDIYLGNVVNFAIPDDGLYLDSKASGVSSYDQYIYNSTNMVRSDVLYVSKSGTGLGLISSEPTTLDKALKAINENGRIIFVESYMLNTININRNVTLAGYNNTISMKRNNTTAGENKYLFNQPKNAKNKKKLCKNISFQLIIYPPI